MAKFNEIIQYTVSEGQVVRRGDTSVTPVSRALTVRLPYWAFVWTRPVSIRVEDGQSTRELAIVDVTLLAQISVISVAFATSVVALLYRRRLRN